MNKLKLYAATAATAAAEASVAEQPTTVSIKLTLTFNDGIIIFVCAH